MSNIEDRLAKLEFQMSDHDRRIDVLSGCFNQGMTNIAVPLKYMEGKTEVLSLHKFLTLLVKKLGLSYSRTEPTETL